MLSLKPKVMNCEICGRTSCTKSFHSLDEQNNFDEVADKVKERAINILNDRISRLKGHFHGDNYYVKLDDVVKILNDYN